MAKTTGTFFSMTASGTLGSTITADKRGHVRVRVIPKNPQSQNQVDARQRVAALQSMLPLVDTAFKTILQTASPVTYQWLSNALGLTIGNQGAAYDAASAAFIAATPTEKGYWDTAAGSIFIKTTKYGLLAPTHVPSDGEVLYIIAKAAYSNNWQPGTPLAAPALTSESATAWAALILP